MLGDSEYVVVIEWGDIVHDVLPEDRLSLQIEHTGEQSRHIRITYPEKFAYVLEGIA